MRNAHESMPMSPPENDYTLASVHVPKTAGTTFQEMLRAAYGKGMRLDYNDRPLAHTRCHRRMTAVRHAASNIGMRSADTCIHGHFLPLKYTTMARMRFCVWLRDPVQRVLSRYHHYARNANETHHLRWGLVPGLTLEQFVRLPQYQNTYAEYFWLFPLRRFDFIGIVEDFDSELERFARHFGIRDELRGATFNRNPDKAGTDYLVQPEQEHLIRACNRRDIATYTLARERFAR